MASVVKNYDNFLDWVIYQIYPKSFYDTNNDGVGDINGITAKLDYLKSLGVNAIWVCPCYKSPYCDNGYDISDYRDIADDLGTLDDIKRLISEMHARDMKLIMDLVPNHTSDKHEWFEKSRSGDPKYKDYYYWFDEPQNDWQATFGGSAWQYDEKRGQYYLHSYAVEQPDLNWENTAVVKEMQDIVDFWVDLGVDGFRCDVIDQISKDFENGKNCFGPNLHKYINALFGRPKTEGIFTVGECWANDIDEIRRHTAPEREELTTLFQFDHCWIGRKDKFTPDIKDLKHARDDLVKWQYATQENGLLYSIFTDNHDQNLYISRAADDGELRYESATCLATMFYLLRGIPFIYQGQEIGITSSRYDSIECFNDVETLNAYKAMITEDGLSETEAMAKINFGSRDNPRRPFPWDGSKYGGFSECEPWIMCSSRLDEINLENDLKSEKSVFGFYKELLKLRREIPALRRGEFAELSEKEDNCFIYSRTLGDEKITVVCNFEKPLEIKNTESFGKEFLTNYFDREEGNIHFRPYETVVFRA